MRALAHTLLRLSVLMMLLVGLMSAGALDGGSAAQAAPALSPAADLAATLPATTCTLTGPGIRTCELWAKAGTLTLPGGVTVPIWGYSDGAAAPAILPGPVLIANEGETVEVILHNDLLEPTALAFPGHGLRPDLAGVLPGATGVYTIPAAAPGTFSYEAELTTNGVRQVAMGLFGALIVRPAGQPSWAYDDAATAFQDEALLIFSEIDPAFNNNPSGFDLVTFAPQYWLINGQAYPDIPAIASTAGNTVLLRIINKGMTHQAFGLLGLHQTVVGIDGSPVPFNYQLVADMIPSGQSEDTLVAIPATAPSGMQYALYETGHKAHNAAGATFGGILTFITTLGAPTSYAGPLAANVQVAPSPTNGAAGVSLTATIMGGTNIVAAEYFADTLGLPGSGVSMNGTWGAPPVAVDATMSAAALAGLSTGEHIFYVRGYDATLGWGPVGSAVLNLVTSGPMITGMVLTPQTTNGSVDVQIRATGDARPSGMADVVAAEYSIDTTGAPGTETPMTLNHVAPVVSLNALIPAATVAGLAEGPHTVYIRAQDSLLNWGDLGQILLNVDLTGPGANSIRVAPNPNNGTLAILPSIQAVRLEAIFSDPLMAGVNSNLERAEGFIDTVGANGTGFPLIAVNGVYDRPSETAYVHIPLSTIMQLAPGLHTIYVHAKDASGNWGATGSVDLIVDKTGPGILSLNVQPNPTGGTQGVMLTATATDPANSPASNIVAAEWFDGVDPGLGNGTPIVAADGAFDSPNEAVSAAISVTAWRPGDHVLSVRAKDAGGNWGSVSAITLTVRNRPTPLVFADGFEAGNFAAWTATVGAVAIAPDAAMGGNLGGAALQGASTLGMAATINGMSPAYLVDGTPNYESAYLANFYFNPNGTDTAGSMHDIFVGRDLSGTPIFGIQYEHNTPTSYEIRAWVLHSGSQVSTDWYDITNGPHLLEIQWVSGTSANFTLSVDGTVQQTLSDLDSSAHLIDEVWLGASLGLTAGMQGTEYYDEFTSVRLGAAFAIYLPMLVRD